MSETPQMKVSHKAILLDVITKVLKQGVEKITITNGALWDGAYLIHSYIDREHRTLHLFYHDPINGIPIQESQDILSVPINAVEFKTERLEDKKNELEHLTKHEITLNFDLINSFQK